MEDRNKRSVASADVALPHRVDGKFRNGCYDDYPGAGRDGAPGKEGPYPSDAKDAHGFQQKESGKLRVIGDPRAHRLGER